MVDPREFLTTVAHGAAGLALPPQAVPVRRLGGNAVRLLRIPERNDELDNVVIARKAVH